MEKMYESIEYRVEKERQAGITCTLFTFLCACVRACVRVPVWLSNKCLMSSTWSMIMVYDNGL